MVEGDDAAEPRASREAPGWSRAVALLRRAVGARTLSALSFLAVLAVVFAFYPVGDPGRLLEDEVPSVKVWRSVARGVDPYDPAVSEYATHPYLPTFLYGGGLLVRSLGQENVLLLQRLLNLASIAALAWAASSAFLRLEPARTAAAILLVFLPPLQRSVEYGNLSSLAAAATIVPLLIWPRRPVGAGILLALGLALKPSGLAAAPLLLLHRTTSPTRRHVRAVCVAGGLLGALVLSTPWPFAFLRQEKGYPTMHDSVGNATLQRLLEGFGLTVPAPIVFAAVVGIGVVVVRLRPYAPLRLALLASFVSLAALSRVWHHSFSIAALAVAGAAVRAVAELRRPASDRARALLNALLVALGIAVVSSSKAWSEDWSGIPTPLLGLLSVVPLGAFLGLSLYAGGGASGVPRPPARADELAARPEGAAETVSS